MNVPSHNVWQLNCALLVKATSYTRLNNHHSPHVINKITRHLFHLISIKIVVYISYILHSNDIKLAPRV